MVLRRSTTRWTWPSDFNSAARSTVTFMSDPPARPGLFEGARKVARTARISQGRRALRSRHYPMPIGRSRRSTGDSAARAADPRGTARGRRASARVRERGHVAPPHSCSCRFSSSISSASAVSVFDQVLDLAHGVQHRGVVAAAEAPSDLRQRAQRQRLGEIHRHLPRAHDVGGAPRRQQVGAAHIVLPRHHALDVLDLDALGLLRADQVAHLALGHFERDRLAGELAVGEQPVERAFEVAAVVGHGLGDEGEHRRRHVEAGMMLLGGGGADLEDFEAQLLAEHAHLDHQPAGEPRAHALVEALEVGRRPVGGDHDLPAGVDQRIERVAELGLGRSCPAGTAGRRSPARRSRAAPP